VRKDAVAEAASGRGLMIVAALTADWGCSAADAGKVVWAVLDAEDGG